MPTPNIDGRRRFVFAACLVAVLLLVAALGWEAVVASRQQRDAVEGVLRDYAELAAEQFARNVAVTLEYEWFIPAQRLADRALTEGETLDAGAEMQGQRNAYRLGDVADGFFRLGSTGERLDTVRIGDAKLPTDLGAVVRGHLDHLDDEWPYAAFIYNAGSSGSGDGSASGGGSVNRDSGDSARDTLVVFRASAAGSTVTDADAVVGFVAGADAMNAFFTQAVGIYDLLPPTLTEGAGDIELVHVSVIDHTGKELFSHGPEGEISSEATFSLPPYLADLRIVASIPSTSASYLVVGGLPYSRLPTVIGMLVITMALLGVGAVLWRRERELMALREDFVAGASHELRTPLAQIRMFAETLRLKRVRSIEEQRRAVEIIDREARRLALLVENLLQFSGSGRRPQRFVPRVTDVYRLAVDVGEGFEPLAAARGTRVVVEGSALEGCVDRDMLRQVLVNLLDNAVKYGPENQTVTLAVSQRPGAIEVSVSDEGVGVPPGERPLVWQRFWRGSQTDQITGTGIGLALVHELVEFHGGSVIVDESAAGGARFVVTVPRERT